MPERDPLAEARAIVYEVSGSIVHLRQFQAGREGYLAARLDIRALERYRDTLAALVERAERQGRQVAAARHFLAAWQDGGGADAATCDAALLLAEALAGEEVAGGDGA